MASRIPRKMTNKNKVRLSFHFQFSDIQPAAHYGAQNEFWRECVFNMASQRDAIESFSCTRFEQLFASSPRAKEIFASVYKRTENEPRRTKATCATQSFERSTTGSLNTDSNFEISFDDFITPVKLNRKLLKDHNSGDDLTKRTPDVIEDEDFSVEQRVDQVSQGNAIFLENDEDDEKINDMESLNRSVAKMLKNLEKGVTEPNIAKEVDNDKKEQVLLNWSLRTVETNNEKNIIVEGYRSGDPEEQNWRSTVICQRVSSNIVRTKSGSVYRLSRQIDEKQMTEKGFSKQFIKAFKNGFPSNWKRLLQTHYKDMQSLEKQPVVIADEKKSPSKAKLNVKRSTRGQKKEESLKPVKNKKTEKLQASKKTSQESKNKTMKIKAVFKTPPTVAFPKEEDVKRSRSGRIIAPPLEYWRGQRMITSSHDDSISIVKSHLEESSVQFVKRPTPLSRKSFWKENFKSKRKSVQGVRPTQSSTELTTTSTELTTTSTELTTASSSTGEYVTSSSEWNVDSDNQPISSIVKTLTYASSDSTVNNIPSKISRKEDLRNSKKSNESETDETSNQCDEFRSGTSKKKFDKQSKKTKKLNTLKKGSKEVVDSDGGMLTSDGGVTEHQDSEDNAKAPLYRVYSLRTRVKKHDAKCSSKEEETRNGVPRGNLRNKMETHLDSSSTEDVSATKKRRNSKGIESSHTETEHGSKDELQVSEDQLNTKSNAIKTQNNRLVSSDTEGGESICERKDVKSKNEMLGCKRKSVGLPMNSKTISDQTETKRKKNGSKNANQDILMSKMSIGDKDEETSDSVISLRSTETTNRNVKCNPRSQTKLQPKGQTHDSMHAELPRVGAKGKGPVVEDESDMSQCEINTVKLVNIMAQKTNKNKNIGKKKTACSQPSTEDEMWAEDELKRLTQALNKVSSTGAMYWQKIARLVKTRSAVECQHIIQKNENTSKRPKKKVPRKIQEKPVVEKLTAKVGTLARKRQLRDILEQQDNGYAIDYFDSTPFRNRQLSEFLPVFDDDQDFTEDMETDLSKSKTPRNRTPVNSLRSAGPLSDSGTSEMECKSPMLLNTVKRNDLDRYVHQVLKKRKVGRRNPRQTTSRTPVPKKVSAAPPLPFDANDCFDIREDSRSEEEDEDCYYWSDVQ